MLLVKMRLYWSGVGPLTQYDRCPFKKEKFVHRQAHRCHVKMKAEIRVMLLTSQGATETVNKTPKTSPDHVISSSSGPIKFLFIIELLKNFFSYL